jgi:hypothetical protein
VHAVLFGAARGDQDHRQRRARAPHLGEDREAVALGQHHVEDGEVELRRRAM